MRRPLFLFAAISYAAFGILSHAIASPKVETLQLDRIFYVHTDPEERFDLSGLLVLTPHLKNAFRLHSDFLLVNDQNSFLYEGFYDGDKIRAKRWLDLSKYYPHVPYYDLEDIDANETTLFAVNEADGSVFEIQPRLHRSPHVILHSWKNTSEKYSFSEPFGVEAIAVDLLQPHKVFLGKEMPGLAVFEVDLKKGQEGLVQTHPKDGSGSQTALRIRGDKVYTLDREHLSIGVEALSNDREEIVLNFADIMKKHELDFEVRDASGVLHPEWNTPEALDIHDGLFYIGLDNNGLPLKSNPKETHSVIFTVRLKSP